MPDLIKEYFQRDLSPREEAVLRARLAGSESEALRFTGEADRYYAALGLGLMGLASLNLGKAGGSSGAGWFGKAAAGVAKLGAIKTTALVGAAVVAASAPVAVFEYASSTQAPHPTAPSPAVPAPSPAMPKTRPFAAPAAPKASAKPERGELLKLKLKLGRGTRLKVWVVNGEGLLVRDLGEKDYPAGEAELIWDGTDDVGEPVGIGKYKVVVDNGHGKMERTLELKRKFME